MDQSEGYHGENYLVKTFLTQFVSATNSALTNVTLSAEVNYTEIG